MVISSLKPAGCAYRSASRRVATCLAVLLCAARGAAFAAGDPGVSPIPVAETDWVCTWAGSPSSPSNNFEFTSSAYNGTDSFNNQTVRLLVHASLGGSRVRIRLSNEGGATPLVIGAAHIAVSGTGSGIVPGTDRALTFDNGRPTVTIPPYALIFSDAVDLDFPALAELSVSLYLPDPVTVTTGVPNSMQTSYVAPAGSGDTTGAAALPLDPVDPTITQWPLLTGVDVNAGGERSFVAFGSSVTLGYLTTLNANARWTDVLAKRLHDNNLPIAVVNASIVADRLLGGNDGALARLQRDALSEPAISYVFINDILGVECQQPNSTSANIIGGIYQVVQRAHSQNVKVYAGTILPLGGATLYTAAFEAKRQAVNAFIRTTGELDGFVDFDAALRDPANPLALLPAYDGGDHHHPNDLGNSVMAHAFNLDLFR